MSNDWNFKKFHSDGFYQITVDVVKLFQCRKYWTKQLYMYLVYTDISFYTMSCIYGNTLFLLLLPWIVYFLLLFCYCSHVFSFFFQFWNILCYLNPLSNKMSPNFISYNKILAGFRHTFFRASPQIFSYIFCLII